MKKMKINKTTKNNLITYGMVLAVYLLVELFIAGGKVSSLMQGLLVPLCVYVILAVSLNLVVGILGELSLGHAGFMCVGAFSSAFFWNLSLRCVVVSTGELSTTIYSILGRNSRNSSLFFSKQSSLGSPEKVTVASSIMNLSTRGSMM